MFQRWGGTHSANHTSRKTRTFQSYNANTTAADDLVTQGKTSATMLLTLFVWTILASAPDELTHWGWGKMAAIFQTAFSNAFSWNENV